MRFPIQLPSSKWMSILLSVAITLVFSLLIPAGSTGFPRRNANNQASSSGEAHPTTEQLRQWIWLLRERRFNLAEPETKESYDMVQDLARIMEERASFLVSWRTQQAYTTWLNAILEHLMPYVIPNEVGLTLRDLLKSPKDGMSLDTLICHWEALKNLQLQYVSFEHKDVVIPHVAKLLQMYRKRIQAVVKATGFGNRTPPTKEQLLQWIWLLRERRHELLVRECTELTDIMNSCVKSPAFRPEMMADEVWDNEILKSMLPYVIPDEVYLTFDDLMAKPADGMSLEMLACHWEALENLQLWDTKCRAYSFHVPRVQDVQSQYTDSIMALEVPAAFGEKKSLWRYNLQVPVITSADLRRWALN
ncbi:hypothetical protein SeMB42_g01810 [Synchytrium endobioticum]|uniref:Uncharacterized protein n=1 Tax=Synchytrium endobioticum TaxID=286115 RepID=A0A507DCW4_9FUNG|nr:hypothetical protein SeLEV6574_g01510 [Synchytrium endobioticum]TPX51770.1 hypothetical protein SeMB42_g01810 [Synchytrium endobioticum]